MKGVRRAAAGVAAFAVATGPAGVAAAGGDHHHDGQGIADGGVVTVAGGLDGPRGLGDHRHGTLLVAESGSGEVSVVDPATGAVETLLSGLVNPQGVDSRRGLVVVAVGESGPPDGAPPPADPLPVGQGGPGLLLTDEHGTVLSTVDTLAHELAENPDGQLQFDEAGVPLDSLSNPFSVLVERKRVLVADAGANAVLSVDKHTGEVGTFFVPPVVTPEEVPGCDMPNNDPGSVGCDSVPTGITRGPDGSLYVSTLGAEVPGAARVYVLTPGGHVEHVLEGFTSATGVAVDDAGAVYVAELFEGAPPMDGPPPADFDPAAVGQIVRVDRHGERTYAQVTMPAGLLVEDDVLYASAWSVAAFAGLPPESGEVVTVGADAFTADSPAHPAG